MLTLGQMWTIEIKSPEEMRQLASLLPEPCVLAIDGPLGAGKTVFAQGLAHGLNIPEPIVSPTFTIANQYPADVPFLHIDLYRLEAHDLHHLALDEEIEDWIGVVLIEWAIKHPSVLPVDCLKIQIEIKPNQPTQRTVSVVAFGETNDILSKWKSAWTTYTD